MVNSAPRQKTFELGMNAYVLSCKKYFDSCSSRSLLPSGCAIEYVIVPMFNSWQNTKNIRTLLICAQFFQNWNLGCALFFCSKELVGGP